MPLLKCVFGLMRFLIIYVNMSVFRHSFHRKSIIVPSPILEKVMTEIVDNKGVSRYVLEDKDSSVASIPKPSEYTLELLLASGIPLNTVSSVVVDNVPSSSVVEQQVNNILNSDNNE